MAEILMARPYLWSTHVWNMFDFGCAARNEGGTAGRNNKGLVTLDRKIKRMLFIFIKRIGAGSPLCICADGGMRSGPGMRTAWMVKPPLRIKKATEMASRKLP